MLRRQTRRLLDLQWRVRITTILKENKPWNFVNTTIASLSSNPIALNLHKVKEAKAQWIIHDGVKDHLIPHLAEKDIVKKMWDAFTKLY